MRLYTIRVNVMLSVTVRRSKDSYLLSICSVGKWKMVNGHLVLNLVVLRSFVTSDLQRRIGH